jgi:hypothetical protein
MNCSNVEPVSLNAEADKLSSDAPPELNSVAEFRINDLYRSNDILSYQSDALFYHSNPQKIFVSFASLVDTNLSLLCVYNPISEIFMK